MKAVLPRGARLGGRPSARFTAGRVRSAGVGRGEEAGSSERRGLLLCRGPDARPGHCLLTFGTLGVLVGNMGVEKPYPNIVYSETGVGVE